MRAALTAGLVALAACAAPAADEASAEAPPDTSETPDAEPLSTPFDAEAWMAAVEAAETADGRVALSERLLDAVDWRTACGEDDPTAPGRGEVRLVYLDARNALAEVVCQRFADQAAFALVDARAGRPPRLVRSFGVSEAGEVSDDTTASFYGLLTHDPDTAPTRFDILTKDAGHGGCGTDVRYRLLEDGGAAVERVRAYADCDAPAAPEAWPVTYRAE